MNLAQDLWKWLIRTGVPMALVPTPWLKEVVHNYIRRFRRRSYWRHTREGRPLEETSKPQSSQPLRVLESRELLDHVAAVLPKREGNLLVLVRRGDPFAEAEEDPWYFKGTTPTAGASSSPTCGGR